MGAICLKKVDQTLANYIGTGSNWLKAVVGLTAPTKTTTRSLLDFLIEGSLEGISGLHLIRPSAVYGTGVILKPEAAAGS